MGRVYTGNDTFNAALDRMVDLYGSGNRVVCSFSAGKDSGVCLELAIEAAKRTDRLPVEVVMRDEEIMLPGTYEYAERCAVREEIDFHWVYANQPIVNAFNRKNPYWWVFDPEVPADEWVRTPPPFAYKIDDLNITSLISTKRFPPENGKDLVVLIGLRASESRGRMFAVHASSGYITAIQPSGYRKARPIYDWSDGDVWRAISENGWDYNTAYNVMRRFGLGPRSLRIAPPTMRAASIEILRVASRAWPSWFGLVSKRCPGIREAARYGKVAVEPDRRLGESWEDCFHRTCIRDAPEWIRERAEIALVWAQKAHASHSTDELPQSRPCPRCPRHSSWEQLAKMLYMGDPFCFTVRDFLPYVEPEYFRKGAGKWGGSPTW